jgi:hypothetical protein
MNTLQSPDEKAYAGKYLQAYESARYSFLELALKPIDTIYSLIVQPDAEEFYDVSAWQAGMNWAEYKKHARAAILRIGFGKKKDIEFEYNYAEAKKEGIALGGYLFYNDYDSPAEQANMVIAAMAGKTFEKEIYVDWEVVYGGPFQGLQNVVATMQAIEAAGIKCKAVGMYTGYYFFVEHSSPTGNAGQYNYLKARPLWLAWYASASIVKTPAPWTESTWIDWQIGTPARKVGQPTAEIDWNKSRYSRDVFAKTYLGEAPTQPPEPPTGEPMTNAIIDLPPGIKYSNMRAGAGSGYTDLGDFFQGTKITYTAVDNGYVRVTSAELNGQR